MRISLGVFILWGRAICRTACGRKSRRCAAAGLFEGLAAIRLLDSKTGARMVPLTPAAAKVLTGLSRTPGNPWVFPGKKKGTRLHNLDESWDHVRKHAGLDGVRLHDLRHSFASRALALGESLPMIGKLLGHTKSRPPLAMPNLHDTR